MSPSGSGVDVHSKSKAFGSASLSKSGKKMDHLKVFEKKMTQKLNFRSMQTKLNLSGIKKDTSEDWKKSSFGGALSKSKNSSDKKLL